MNRFILHFTALILGARLFAAPTGSQNQPGASQKEMRSCPQDFANLRTKRIAEKLKLSEDQQNRIKAIRERHREELKVKRQAQRDARREFHQLLRSLESQDAQIRSAHERLSATRLDLILAHRAMRKEISAVLTPEQKEKAKEMIALSHARHHIRRKALEE